MKHLLVANVFFAPRSYGGATVVAEEVARALARSQNWRVTVLSFSDYGDQSTPALIRTRLPDGIDHFTLNRGGGGSPELAFENPAMNQQIAALIETLQPDVAHLHCIQELGIGLIDVLADANVPTILSTHDYWWLCERSFMINNHGQYCGQKVIDKTICASCVTAPETLDTRWQHAMAALQKPALITYPSAESRAHYERNGAPQARGQVIPNGVAAPGPDYRAKRAQNQDNNRIRFGYIGGPGPIKGWPMIERAFRALSSEQAELVLVDAASNVGTSWWGQYRFGALADHVTVVPGYTMETVDDFYAGIDVLLFLSTWRETFGLTSREAALRGVHVLATDCGAPVEPLINGDTGTILPGFGSAGAVRAALKKLVTDGIPKPTPNGLEKIATEVLSYSDQARQIEEALLRIMAEPH